MFCGSAAGICCIQGSIMFCGSAAGICCIQGWAPVVYLDGERPSKYLIQSKQERLVWCAVFCGLVCVIVCSLCKASTREESHHRRQPKQPLQKTRMQRPGVGCVSLSRDSVPRISQFKPSSELQHSVFYFLYKYNFRVFNYQAAYAATTAVAVVTNYSLMWPVSCYPGTTRVNRHLLSARHWLKQWCMPLLMHICSSQPFNVVIVGDSHVHWLGCLD